MPDDLGIRLMAASLVNAAQVAEASRSRIPLAPALVNHGLSEFSLESFLRDEGYSREEALDPTAEALARLPGGVAQRLWALPLRMDPEGLVVAMVDPSDKNTARELSLICGALLVPRLARVSELKAALDRAYPNVAPSADPRQDADITFELTRPRTPASVAARYSATPAGDDSVPLLRVKRQNAAGTNAVGTGPVVTARRFSKPAGSDAPSLVPSVRPKESGHDSAGETATAKDVGDIEVIVDSFDNKRNSLPPLTKSWSSSPPPRRAAQPYIEIEITDSWDDMEAVAEGIKRHDHAPEGIGAPRRSYANKPARVPGDISTTLARMRTLRHRDAVLTMGCEAALLVSRTAVFLALRNQVLRGWSGLGGSLTADAVRNLWIPLSTPSMFRGVVADGKTYAGPYGGTAADNLFRAATGSRGGVVVVCPVEVMDKTVAVMVADDVRFGDDGRERIETLAQAVGDALKGIILARKG